jgi:DNA/RNA-binding protein KIN17
MPRAEVGSTKYLNNKLKSKGLQRLRWYCQVCERQMRDENGFKMHTQSEGHVRAMLLVGENARKHIHDFSQQFKSDFLSLLRTSHGTKSVHANHFYQEYISSKEHVHMNATRWTTLTEFVGFLGREGICRVEEGEKGLEIAWIDNSPEALRRQDAIRKRERMEKGDEEREQKLIQEQVERARRQAEEMGDEEIEEEAKELQREDGKKITLNFGKPLAKEENKTDDKNSPISIEPTADASLAEDASKAENENGSIPEPSREEKPEKVSLSFGSANKPKNVFASMAKKNVLGGSKQVKPTTQRPMSEAERIMKEEIERKRKRESLGFNGFKKQKS